jgi:hypothetical protein
MGVVCGVPEGHVFAADLGSTGEPNPCLVCGCQILVPYKGPNDKQQADSDGCQRADYEAGVALSFPSFLAHVCASCMPD